MAITGSCHCGRIRFSVPALPESLTRCTCSHCHRLGGLWAYYPPDRFTLLSAKADRTLYRWGTRVIDHYFCGTCGCFAYRDSPLFNLETRAPEPGERQICVNARLFEDTDIERLRVTVIDGRNLW